MNIAYLNEYPEFIEEVSNWIYTEFVLQSKEKVDLYKVTEYFSNTSKENFPITFIALKNVNA